MAAAILPIEGPPAVPPGAGRLRGYGPSMPRQANGALAPMSGRGGPGHVGVGATQAADRGRPITWSVGGHVRHGLDGAASRLAQPAPGVRYGSAATIPLTSDESPSARM
jgi:hypothetical protein